MRDRTWQVVWSPRAKQDLIDIWTYYAPLASPEVADKLLREIDQAGQQLSREALMWRERPEIVRGIRARLVSPHTIFYRIQDDTVEIARVLHERRNFPDVLRNK